MPAEIALLLCVLYISLHLCCFGTEMAQEPPCSLGPEQRWKRNMQLIESSYESTAQRMHGAGDSASTALPQFLQRIFVLHLDLNFSDDPHRLSCSRSDQCGWRAVSDPVSRQRRRVFDHQISPAWARSGDSRRRYACLASAESRSESWSRAEQEMEQRERRIFG